MEKGPEEGTIDQARDLRERRLRAYMNAKRRGVLGVTDFMAGEDPNPDSVLGQATITVFRALRRGPEDH